MNAEQLIKPMRFLLTVFAVFAVWFPVTASADNPIVSHVYTADPAARVFGDRVYVVTSHDLDDQDGYNMYDYYLFSSDDMVNWQDHGVIWNSRTDTSWANLAYAPDIIERNGRYYLYFPDGGGSIGVAVADSPEGPYSDPLGRPLIDHNTPNGAVQWIFDPGVFIDDDGQAYLYFGGGGEGNARVIRLNDDMISTSGSAISIDVPNFFEALYMHKRNGIYYLTYSTDTSAGLRVDYMTSNSPTSGFQYRGTVLGNPWENNNNNNHASITEYQNRWYAFYHNRAVSNERGASDYQRSVNVDRLHYNGSAIEQVNDGPAGVQQLKYVNAFARNEAETFDTEEGIETEPASEGSRNLMMGNGDWVRITGVDFGSGATGIDVRVAAENASSMEIILDGLSNAPLASMQIGATGGWQTYQTQSASFPAVSGVHDVYLRSSGYHNLNWYQFTGDGTSSSSSSSGNVNTITVRMSGTVGDESVSLEVGGTTIQTWTLSTYMLDYNASTNAVGDVRLAFTNDAGDRDVQVDYLIANGVTYQAEDQQDNTGAWDGECGAGSYSEMLHCNGSIGFGNILGSGISSSSSTSSSSSSSSSSSNSSASSSSHSSGGDCSGVNVYPNWTAQDWSGGEYNHAEAGDQMVYQNTLYQANWYTKSVPGSDASWTSLGACG
jgi:arabinoxylan arabinofuranohydrolase